MSELLGFIISFLHSVASQPSQDEAILTPKKKKKIHGSLKRKPSSPVDLYWARYSVRWVSLYIGGLFSDKSSFIGPYALSLLAVLGMKKHAADTRAPIFPAHTLCSTLLNLSLVMSYKNGITSELYISYAYLVFIVWIF